MDGFVVQEGDVVLLEAPLALPLDIAGVRPACRHRGWHRISQAKDPASGGFVSRYGCPCGHESVQEHRTPRCGRCNADIYPAEPNDAQARQYQKQLALRNNSRAPTIYHCDHCSSYAAF